MNGVLNGDSLTLVSRDKQVVAGVEGVDAASGDAEAVVRRRDFYGLVWRTANKKTRDKVFPSTKAGLATAVLGTMATYILGDTVGPALLSVSPASDGEGKAVLGVAAFVVVAIVRWSWVLADELLAAPAQFWADSQQEAARLTSERDVIQQRLTDDVANVERRITTLMTPSFELYADDLNSPPFFQENGVTRGQYIVKIGLRTRQGVRTVRGVRVRLERAISVDESPELELNAAAPLEIEGGTTPFGTDLHPGGHLYAQLLVIQPSLHSLPAVRVFYWPPNLTEYYAPLPFGEWRLEICATGEDTSAEIRYVSLTVRDDPDPRRRVTLKLLPDDEY